MKIVVCVKYVPDAQADRRFAADNTTDRDGVDGLLSELDEYAVEEALRVSRGALLQCHGLMAVGKSMHDAAKRAMMLEETAKVLLYCKQFGGELTLIPDEWVQNLAGIREFL